MECWCVCVCWCLRVLLLWSPCALLGACLGDCVFHLSGPGGLDNGGWRGLIEVDGCAFECLFVCLVV